MLETCPHCGASWRGDPIPEKYAGYYLPGTTHYSRLIAVYDQERDRTSHFECPDCDKRIERAEVGR